MDELAVFIPMPGSSRQSASPLMRVVLIACSCVALSPATVISFISLRAAEPQQSASAEQRARESYEAGVEALKRRDLATARAKFEEAAKLIPGSAEAHNSLGYVLLLSGDADAAIPQFKSAIRLMPTLAQAHANLSTAFWQKKKAAEAVR